MNDDNIKEYAFNWLSQEGFLLEMQVAKSFIDNGFDVTSSEIYQDPITKIGREIDVIASMSTMIDNHLFFDITFIIECKYSTDKPWIMFKSSSNNFLGKKYDFMHRSSSQLAKVSLLELENFDNELKDNILFAFKDSLYYGLKRAHKGKDLMINEAINQVANAVQARGIKIDSFNSVYISTLEFQFPIIVVQGKLFETFLSIDQKLELKEISYGRLLTSKPEFGNQRFYIDVVTFNYLNEYIKMISEATREVLNYTHKLETTKTFIKNKNSK